MCHFCQGELTVALWTHIMFEEALLTILIQIQEQLQNINQLFVIIGSHASLHTSTSKTRKLIHTFKLNSLKKPVLKLSPRRQQILRFRKDNLFDIRKMGIFDRTGLFSDHFEQIYIAVANCLQDARTGEKRIVSRTLHPRVELLMALQFLRENPLLRWLAREYRVHHTTVIRTLKHVLPILFVSFSGNIQFPTSFQIVKGFFSIAGAVDCTPHFRTRVHPGSLEYYRGDYKDYFLTAQLVVGVDGTIWQVDIGYGHNNDMKIYQLSQVAQKLPLNVNLCSDKGYVSQDKLITPRHMEDESQNSIHKRVRSIVERVFGFVKMWKIASTRFRMSPEYQRICLMIVYNIVQQISKEFPLLHYSFTMQEIN